MDVSDIVKEYLEANADKYDGLASDLCGCETSDLAPCGDMKEGCELGWRKSGCSTYCGEGCDFHIVAGPRPSSRDDPEAALNTEELAALRLRELAEGEAAAQEQSGGAFVAGERVWYEPHDGVRFAGVVTGPGTLEGTRAVLLVGTYWLWRAMDRSVHFTHREAFAVREGCLLRRDGPSIGVDGAYEREKMSRESEGEER